MPESTSSRSSSPCSPVSPVCPSPSPSRKWRVYLRIEGVSCPSASGQITRILLSIPSVSNVAIEPFGHALVEYYGRRDEVDELVERIEDTGHDARLTRQVPVFEVLSPHNPIPYRQTLLRRNAKLRFKSLSQNVAHIDDIVRVARAIHDNFGDLVCLTEGPGPGAPVLSITYMPCPSLTIRHIIAVINSEVPTVRVELIQSKTIDNLPHLLMNQKLALNNKWRLFWACSCSIVAFCLTVGLNWVLRIYPSPSWMPMWLRKLPVRTILGTSAVDLLLLILATLTMIHNTYIFFKTAVMGLRAHRGSMHRRQTHWGPESRISMRKRLYRFDSTYLLGPVALSVAYLVSLIQFFLTFAGNVLAGLSIAYWGTWTFCLRDGYMYFDTVIYFTMFLHIGRILEALAKRKTDNSLKALAKDCPSTALVLDNSNHQNQTYSPESSFVETPFPTPTLLDNQPRALRLRRVETRFLDIGELVRVQHQGTPPCDGILEGSVGTIQLFARRPISTTRGGRHHEGPVASFNEASLLGEQKAVRKRIGDPVYAGTRNKGPPVLIRVTAIPRVQYSYGGGDFLRDEDKEEKVDDGTKSSTEAPVNSTGNLTLLDGILEVRKDGEDHGAMFARANDGFTMLFTPIIILIVIVVITVWTVGQFRHWSVMVYTIDLIDIGKGTAQRCGPIRPTLAYMFKAMQHAVAVLIAACPHGLALATPVVVAIGSAMAASRYGVLIKGGAEAMEKVARGIDCVVFAKTGTLTTGVYPKVVDAKIFLGPDGRVHGGQVDGEQQDKDAGSTTESTGLQFDIDDFKSALRAVEEQSTRTVARAIVTFCKMDKVDANRVGVVGIEETPGMGIKGHYPDKSSPTTSSGSSQDQIDIIVGNGDFMDEHGVAIPDYVIADISQWQAAGNSIALVALRRTSKFNQSKTVDSSVTSGTYSNNSHGHDGHGQNDDDNSDGETVNSDWPFILVAALSVSDSIRPQAKSIINLLKSRRIDVWMISGDNAITARAMAQSVGISQDRVIADVLPADKHERIKYLQSALVVRSHFDDVASHPRIYKSDLESYLSSLWHWKPRKRKYTATYKGKQTDMSGPDQHDAAYPGIELDHRNLFIPASPLDEVSFREQFHEGRRAVVAMVGDGMKDAAALETADVGFAIWSGNPSNGNINEGKGGQIAASAADFVLLNNHLGGIVTMMDLCVATRRRVRWNIIWAVFLNVITVSLAAGAWSPLGVRISPQSAGITTVFGTGTVILSSLGLGWPRWLGGFKEKKMTFNNRKMDE